MTLKRPVSPVVVVLLVAVLLDITIDTEKNV
jgi:hypothetical protein